MRTTKHLYGPNVKKRPVSRSTVDLGDDLMDGDTIKVGGKQFKEYTGKRKRKKRSRTGV